MKDSLVMKKEAFDEPPKCMSGLLPEPDLGDFAVVSGIIDGFVEEIFEWLLARSSGNMDGAEMKQAIRLRGQEFSAIFAGDSPDYRPVAGWNSRLGGLCEVLRIELGDYWQAQRYRCDDDPYRVMYAWLVSAVCDSITENSTSRAQRVMGGSIEQAVRVLTGMPRAKDPL
ncbi:MAG: hypothetical protein V5B32_07025 [Candidatus Accumulibacter sp. UW26]|jgi:hypothetical protein